MGFWDFFKPKPAVQGMLVEEAIGMLIKFVFDRQKPKTDLRDIISAMIAQHLPAEYRPLLDEIQRGDYSTLEHILVVFGEAFGVSDHLHWSMLDYNTQEKLLNVCPILRERHKDWLIFKNVPRTLGLWVGSLPPVLDGNTDNQQPIPHRGDWFNQRGYIAITTESGQHFHIGWRHDDVESAKWNKAGGRGHLFFLSVTIKDYD